MKTLPLLLVAALLVSGCTTRTTTTTSTRSTRQYAAATHDARYATPEERRIANRRTYTQEDLQKTGHPTMGGALQAVDPGVYISGR